MLSNIVPAALLGASVVSAAPFTFPLPNGFPDIKIPSPALTRIEEQAHGTLPNTPLLKSLSPTDVTSFQVIATGETFEVAFYTSLLRNISSGVPGYEVGTPEERAFALEALRAIQAQEELHALGANAILATAGEQTIGPCEYVFPSTTYETAIDTARTFTDVVLGTLQAVQLGLAETGDAPYIPLIGSIIGQEGEQVGWFRTVLDLIPSELPFLTASAGPFAYSAINQLFIVPGSCPDANLIDVPIFPPLVVANPEPAAKTQNLAFEFVGKGAYHSGFSLVYINQQNLPIVEKPKNIVVKGDVVTFEAAFPYDEYLLNGLTIAAVTSSAGPFENAAEVADATLYGPGLIEVR